MLKKVLLSFDDPGGGLAVASLIDGLYKKGLGLKIYAGKHNEKYLNDKNIDYDKMNSMITKELSEKMIDDFKPDILITGTSGGNAEQELRNRAFEKNIKSVVILDFWKDYSRRWKYASYPVDKLHDTVCVMDVMTKREMTEERFPEEKLIVTGNPYLDEIFNNKKNDADEHDSVSAGNNLKNILFLSQPLETIGIKDYKIHPLEILLTALKKISIDLEKMVSLKIKIHPLEEKSKTLSEIIERYNTDKMNVSFSNENKSLVELYKESQIIIGYNTIAMFEARAMNKRTLSLNVVPVRNSLKQAMETAGIEIVNADKSDITDCLMKDNIVKRDDNIFQGGISNCMEVVLKELNIN